MSGTEDESGIIEAFLSDISKPIQALFGGTFACQAAESNGTEPVSCMVQLPGGQVGQVEIVTFSDVLVQSSWVREMTPVPKLNFKKMFSPVN